MTREETMLIENLTTQIETMNKNHREDNDRLHSRLNEYNTCNQENTKTLTQQGGKIKALRVDMDIVKPQAAAVPSLAENMKIVLPHVQDQLIEKKGKAIAIKIGKGILWTLMAVGSIYGAWAKYKGM